MTVRDLVATALREIGVLAAGEPATADDAADGLSSLNRLVDQWAAERLQVYQVVRTTWTVVSGTGTYTVGSGGTVNVARPVYVDHVNVVDTSPNPDLELQLQPLTDDAWSRVPQKALQGALPTSWYYNPTYPLGTLKLWPVPTSSTLLGAIYAPEAVERFDDLNSAVALPPGYERMLVKNLALELCVGHQRKPEELLVVQAMESKEVVKRSNMRLSDLQFDGGALIQGGSRTYGYSILTGP